ERHDGNFEAAPVPIQEENGIEEGVAELDMQRPVGIGEIEPVLDKMAREIFGTFTMAANMEYRGLGLALEIYGRTLRGLRPDCDGIVSQHAEARYDHAQQTLVLVDAPDEHEVGPEGVELGAQLAHLGDELLAMPFGKAGTGIVRPYAAHPLGPAGRVPQRFGQA